MSNVYKTVYVIEQQTPQRTLPSGALEVDRAIWYQGTSMVKALYIFTKRKAKLRITESVAFRLVRAPRELEWLGR